MKSKPFYLAVRGILENEAGKVLLMQRSAKCKHQPLYWEYPGGKVDEGEDFAIALVREFKEETGLDVAIECVLGAGQLERKKYVAAYLFLKVSQLGGSFQISKEHDDYAWMDPHAHFKAKISPQLEEIRDKYLKS